jgi:ribonuclease HII
MKNIDKKYLLNGKKYLAGTDEAGRGPLAGPVVAAAVIFPNDYFDGRINDSKQIKEKLREELFYIITKNALAYSYTVISHKKIDEINILKASLLAMKKSVDKLKIHPDIILVDGNKTFSYDSKVIPVVKGDTKSLSIAAASIIAKVIRDRIMIKLAKKYPQYGWDKNKGYPTEEHIKAVLRFGATPYHRETFLNNIFNRLNQTHLSFSE